MKKIAIITIFDENNYGNRLQNYALQNVLEKYTCKVDTINNKCSKGGLKRQIKELCIYVYKKFDKKIEIERRNNFNDFTKKFIRLYNKKIYTGEKNLFLNDEYDKFVIGSDQIWNYNFRNGFGNFEFALFSEKKKCISYAASFGIDEIPDDKKNLYINGLNHLQKISVREKEGVEIINKLVNRNSTLVLDPTMLLTPNDWLKISKKPQNMTNKKYVLTYFLGEKKYEKIDEIKKYIEDDFDIININDINQPNYYICGPCEFIYLFNKASIILTDSFHACVFSILFEKNFFVFERINKNVAKMNSRIDTLLNKFNLNDRKIDSLNENIIKNNIDYTDIKVILNDEIKKSFEYLKTALGENS